MSSEVVQPDPGIEIICAMARRAVWLSLGVTLAYMAVTGLRGPQGVLAGLAVLTTFLVGVANAFMPVTRYASSRILARLNREWTAQPGRGFSEERRWLPLYPATLFWLVLSIEVLGHRAGYARTTELLCYAGLVGLLGSGLGMVILIAVLPRHASHPALRETPDRDLRALRLLAIGITLVFALLLSPAVLLLARAM